MITLGDGPPSEFYYNGKTMTAFAPQENLIAVADAPPTIDAALEAAYHLSGTYFPFTDLIVADPYKDMAPGLTLAYYVGQSHIVGDTTTDIVAYVENGVFIEVWLGAEDKLPRVIHAIYLDDPAQLRHNLLLSHWQLDPPVPADAFSPAKSTASAAHIPFAHPLQTAAAAEPLSVNPLNRNDAEAAEVMKNIILGLAGLAVVVLPCEATFGYGHANSYGGSSSHSYGSSSHSNPYGGSTSASAGQGASHTNAYGGSSSANSEGASHPTPTVAGPRRTAREAQATPTSMVAAPRGPTAKAATHTNTYGGTTSGAYGEGATHTYTNGTTAYASAYHPPAPLLSARGHLCVPPTHHGRGLRIELLQL